MLIAWGWEELKLGADSKGQFARTRTQLLHPARAPAAYSPRHQSTMEVAWDAELPKDCRHPKFHQAAWPVTPPSTLQTDR